MRRETNNKKPMGIHVGSATLVMVFAVICLTIFAVLAVITANNAWKLAEKMADGVTAHYDADAQAQAIFEALDTTYDQGFTLPTSVECQVELVDGQEYVSYWVPIDENQSLWVQVYHARGRLQVAHWQVEQVGTWIADQTLNVWSGG